MATVVGLTAEATVELIEAAKARATHTGTQLASTISDFAEASQDLMSTTLTEGTNIDLTYNDVAGTLTITSTASGINEGIPLSAYTMGVGSASANTTAINAAIAAAVAADKPLLNDLGAITIAINARINMAIDKFIARFNGLTLDQQTANTGCVRLGGEAQDIDGLSVYCSTNPNSSQTNANGFEFTNSYMSRYTNLTALNCARGFYMPQSAPAVGDPGSNTVFSCVFDNIMINGWSISAIDFQTWVAGAARSTGNHWSNIYCHNNFFGSPAAGSACAVYFRAFDEQVFNQFNIEWCAPTLDALYLQECTNFIFNSLHFEGITLTGNCAMVRAYYDTRVTVHAMQVVSTTIFNGTGQRALFKVYSGGGNPVSIDATSVRVRSTTNAGARPFGLVEVESGSTGGDCEFRKVDLGDFTGSVVVDNTTVSPSQVSRYNDVVLRNIVALNSPVDKVRTTDASGITNTTLVTDSVMQFAATPGTYMIEGMISYTVPPAADLKLRPNFSGTATGKFFFLAENTSATTSSDGAAYWEPHPLNSDDAYGGVTSIEVALMFRGTIVVTVAGTFSIQYAQWTSNATALVVKAFSHMTYRKSA